MYKNNSGLIAKTKVSKYKKGLYLTEKLMSRNPPLTIHKPLIPIKLTMNITNKDKFASEFINRYSTTRFS
jgi:hypothetical protein